MGFLSEKVILVTGGAHRVGKAITLALAGEGAHLAITYHASREQAQQTVEQVSALGVRCRAYGCDQRDPSQIVETVQAVVEEFGRLDGLVNNASVMSETSFIQLTPEIWDETFNTNTRGPFFFSQACATVMQLTGGGVIINLLDESAQVPTKYYMAHGASKAALRMLTLSMALELAPLIRVNAVLPGPVLMPPDADPERWQRLENRIPLKRQGNPEDVARAVLYLMKEDYITGHVLVVDGGKSIK